MPLEAEADQTTLIETRAHHFSALGFKVQSLGPGPA